MEANDRGSKIMMCYKDKTFCASPNCKNECGRQITDQQRGEAQRLGLLISWGYFCGEPDCDHEWKDTGHNLSCRLCAEIKEFE